MNGLDVLSCILAFAVGVVVFIFANVVIYCLPKKEKIKFEFFKGRYNGEKLSPRFVAISILGGIFAAGLTAWYGAGLYALTVFLVLTVLTIITFIDIDVMEIPPILNIAILVLGIISIWTIGGVSIVSRIIGMFCISLPLFLIVLVIPDGFGGGDIKMMFAAGFLLGWKATVAAFLIGLVLGGAYGIFLLVRRKKGKKDHFAFGPFLSIGIAISMFCGTGIVDAYLKILQNAFTAY